MRIIDCDPIAAYLEFAIVSNANSLDRSPRPVCFWTPSQTYASPLVQRVRRKNNLVSTNRDRELCPASASAFRNAFAIL